MRNVKDFCYFSCMLYIYIYIGCDKQLYKRLCPSVCLFVCHSLFTVFPCSLDCHETNVVHSFKCLTICRSKGWKLRPHWLLEVVVVSNPWLHTYFLDSLDIWHIYNPWFVSVAHHFKVKRQRQTGRLKILMSPPWLCAYLLRGATTIRSIDLLLVTQYRSVFMKKKYFMSTGYLKAIVAEITDWFDIFWYYPLQTRQIFLTLFQTIDSLKTGYVQVAKRTSPYTFSISYICICIVQYLNSCVYIACIFNWCVTDYFDLM